ncbi:polyprotein [Sapporo-HK299 virus]|uniref:Genome polyprotein n=74 Tax=Norovirus TaxID=142786 RepID=A0A076JAH1_NORV|nr:polyprotein [Norovirus GII/Hu/JP/2007/GII.P15_GII.15/Sapporo/HK299]AII73758.1 polyprotein [Sapporo-HK299 virus]
MRMASSDVATAFGSQKATNDSYNTPPPNKEEASVLTNVKVGFKKILGAVPKASRQHGNTQKPSTVEIDGVAMRVPSPPPNGEDAVHFVKETETIKGLPDLSTVENESEHSPYTVPPLSEREHRPATEPLPGTILEMWDGEFYHYSIYVDNGKALGVHKPPAAISLATIDLTPISLYWRPVYTPPYLVHPETLKGLAGEKFPYTAFNNNCYNFCCWVLDLNDSWLNRRSINRTTGFFKPYQAWNRKPLPTVDDGKIKKVANAVLCALGSLFSKPIKDLLGKLKPLNLLNLLASCDWTFAGVVETVILAAELFNVFWTPPDVSNFIASIIGDFEMQGPENLAVELVPVIMGGIGMVLGFTAEKIGRMLSSAASTLRACKDLGNYALDILKLVMKWFFPKKEEKAEMETLRAIEDAVLDMEAIGNNHLTTLLKDKDSLNAYMKTLDMEEEKARKLSTKSSSPDIVGTINAILARIAAARSLLHKAKEEMFSRARPVVVMVSGRPGIGKTYLARQLAKSIASSMSGDQRVGLVPRNGVDHWDAYRGERVVLWDDYGMGNTIKDALTLQELADTCPVTLNCDRIENKGKMFDSDVIIITTNLVNPAPLDYVNFEACCRRIDFLVYAEAPDIEKVKKDFPGQPDMWRDHFKADSSHIKLSLAPQGGFDKNGNTPHGKGTMKTLTLHSLTARVMGLVCERKDEFQLQGDELQVYNFDTNKVSAFRKLAADNKYSFVETMKVGAVLKNVRTLEDLKSALKGVKFKECEIIYKGAKYRVASDGCGSVSVSKIKDVASQTANEVHTALLRLRQARARYYISCFQDLIYTLIQVAGASFVVHRISKRFSWDRWIKPSESPQEEEQPSSEEATGRWEIEPKDTDPEGKKGKNKKGRGRKHTAFSSKGLSDEEYDEFKRIREEKNGKYSIEEYLQDRDRFYEEVAVARATEEDFCEEEVAKIRQRIFRPTKKQRKEERGVLGLVTGSEIRKRRPDDFQPKGNLWADDTRSVDYNEKLEFEAPPSVWSRIVPLGTGWGFWVSSNLLISLERVLPKGVSELFGVDIKQIQIHKSGEFCRFRFPRPIRPDVTGLILEEGAPEGTVCSILVKRPTGEMIPLAVRMGTHASMKIQGRTVGGQMGMLLTGANAKNMDLGTNPGDCGCPYIFKRGNDIVVAGVHTAAARGGNTVICATQGADGEAVLEGGEDKGTYCGAPILGLGKAPKLCTKTKFWRSSPDALPPGTYEPAYLGGKDPRVEKGPSLQQVMREQLKPFTEPRGKPPKPSVLDEAKKTVMNVLEQTINPAKPWSYSQACASLDKTTSSGSPHHLRKNDHWNGESFTGPLADQASKANLMYEQAKHVSPVYTAALKDELVKTDKIYNKIKKRLLWGSDLGTMVRCARAFGGLMDSMKESCVMLPCRVGMNMNEDGPIIFDKHAKYKYHYDADYSRWDSTQQRCILSAAMEVMVKFSAEPELAQVVAEDLLAPSQLDVGDFVVSVQEGLPSGVPCTSQWNSIAHWIITLSAMSEVSGLSPDVIQAHSCFSFYGDDEIVSTDINLDPAKLTLKLREYGLVPTRPDKTEGPLVITENLHGLTFLRRHITRDPAGWFGKLDQDSILRQLYWTRGPNHENPYESMVPHSQRATQLMALLGEASLHGPQFYKKVSKMVINEIKSGGLEFYVPRQEAMFRWMRFSDLSTWEGDRNLAPDGVNEDGVE